MLLLAAGAFAQSTNGPHVGFFTGNGNGWTNYIYAGASTKMGVWPTAIIYNTKRTLTNTIALTWDRAPETNVTYTVYYGDLNVPGPTNTVNCATNQYAVFWNLNTNVVAYFFFVRAKDMATLVEGNPSNLLVAPPQ